MNILYDASFVYSYDRFRALAQVCDAHITRNFLLNQTVDSECVNWLKNISVSKEEMLMFCKWRNEASSCDDMFSETLTEEGICYTFNSLSAEDLLRQEMLHMDYQYVTKNFSSTQWSLETGYREDADIDTYPVRVLGAGARAGLNILLRLYNYDLDYLCRVS